MTPEENKREVELIALAKENMKDAKDEYQKARIAFGQAKARLDVALSQAYANEQIKQTLSAEKAYIMLAVNDESLISVLEDYNVQEQTYKSWGKIIDTKQAYINLHQSLMKYRKSIEDEMSY
jgi:outer membrane usher protein FimD/PapC